MNEKNFRMDSEFRYTLFPIVYSIIFVLGVISNGYVLWVFVTLNPAKKLNEIKIFMVNLTVADLLFLVALPLWIVYYFNEGDWILPKYLCNVAGCFFFINTYCSVAFLGVITYNRFQAVTDPIKAAQHTTRRRGIILSLIIWIVIVGCALYFLFLESTNVVNSSKGNVTRCFENYEEGRVPVLIIHVFIVICFFIVFFVILVCNVIIIRTLLSQPLQPQNNANIKHKALWMVCTVMAVFFICFVPHHIVQLPWTLAELKMSFQEISVHQRINDAHQVTLCLMSINCVLDPIIYCFLTKKFRKHLSERLQSMRGSRKCSRVTTDTGIEVALPLSNYPINSVNN